jgi:tRNA 2-thiouridine synthesizing protein C
VKKILFVLRNPPHSGANPQEILDTVMTAAAFDQAVNILLLDDGVFLMKANQYPESYGLKNIASIFNALPLYDIETIYMETESLQERGLSEIQLTGHITKVDRKNIGDFLNQFDLILNS